MLLRVYCLLLQDYYFLLVVTCVYYMFTMYCLVLLAFSSFY